MNRIIVLGLFLLCFGIDTEAQKVKKDGLGYYNYFQPRASTQLDDAELYFLKVEISDGDAYRRGMFEEQLAIEKFKMASADDEAHFTINIVEMPFKFGESTRKSFSEKYKAGEVEKTRTMYYYEGKVSHQYILKVLDASGAEILREVISGTTTARGRNSSSMREAHSFYIKDKLTFKENAVKSSAEKIQDYFNEQYVDVEKTIHVRIPYVKDGKFEYPGFAAAVEDLKKAYDLLNGNNGMPLEAEEALKRCLLFWPEFLKDAEPENKKARVNREVAAAAYYNLGMTHFLAENWADAAENFQKAAELEKNIVAGVQNWAYVSGQCAERLANR